MGIGEQLGVLYREWSEKFRVVEDRFLPLGERLAALRWIDEQTGVVLDDDEYTQEMLEAVTLSLETEDDGVMVLAAGRHCQQSGDDIDSIRIREVS